MINRTPATDKRRPRLFIVAALFLNSLFFQNCDSKPRANASSSEAPSGFSAGFPNWERSPAYLPISTVRSEQSLTFDSRAVPVPTVLIMTTGRSDYRYEDTLFQTVRVTEIGSSGGMIHLTLMPDGRYRFFIAFTSEYYGSSGTQITREYGTYVLTGNELKITPAWSTSETLLNGQISTKNNPLDARSYVVTLAVLEDLGILGPQRTNEGVILRGACPAYLLPDTCLTSNVAEMRLQEAIVK